MNTQMNDFNEIHEWIEAHNPRLDATSVNHSTTVVYEWFHFENHLRGFYDFLKHADYETIEYIINHIVGRFEPRYHASHYGRGYKSKETAISKLMAREGLTADEAERRVITDFIKVK